MYVIIDPFSPGTSTGAVAGVNVYTKLMLTSWPLPEKPLIISRPVGLSKINFRSFVRDELAKLELNSDDIVEAPESAASTLEVVSQAKIHIRCHCPSAVASFFDKNSCSPVEIRNEIAVIQRADIISAPSMKMAQVIANIAKNRKIHVYPNPLPNYEGASAIEKTCDILFIARTQILKGIAYLEDILLKLPKHFRVSLVGAGTKELRLSSKILCQVSRWGELRGKEKEQRFAESKVLMHLSEFESFGYPLAEAMSFDCNSVSWDVGIAERLLASKICRLVEGRNISEFVTQLIDAVENSALNSSDYHQAHADIRQEFTSGILNVLAGRCSESLVVPEPKYIEIIDGSRRESVSARIMFDRKIKKLMRDPLGFFRDVKIPMTNLRIEDVKEKVGKASSALNATTSVKSTARQGTSAKPEPRLFGDIHLDQSNLVIDILAKKVAEPDRATVVFIPRDGSLFCEVPLLGEACSDKEFFGFRDRYLFGFTYDLATRFTELHEIEALYNLAPKEWNGGVVSEIRNSVFVDPKNILPVLIGATNPRTRVIVFLSDEPASFLETLQDPLDVLVCLQGVDNAKKVKALKRIEVSSQKGWIPALKGLIVAHRNIEKNMFVTAFGEVNQILDMGELLESHYDGVIFLNESWGGKNSADCLREIVNDLVKNVDGVLVREEIINRYSSVSTPEELASFILGALRNGSRFDVRS